MMRRLLGPVFAGALAMGVSACDIANTSSSATVTRPMAEVTPAAAPVDIGEPLFPPAAVPTRQTPAPGAADPIIIRQCQVTLAETQNVPSKNSGRLMHFCTEIQPGEVVPPDQIIIHPRTKVKYRRLKEGDTIKADQLIGYLDDKLAAANLSIELATIKANEAKLEAAGRLREATQQEYTMYYNLFKAKAGSESEMRRSKAQFNKSEADVADAEGQLLKAKEDRNKAHVILDEHEVRSTIPGTIKRFYRRPGESVKELDPIAEVQNVDKLRVEGLLEVQYLPALAQLRAGGRQAKVIVESSPQIARTQQLLGHLQSVRAVAVNKDLRRPLIVSAGEDRTARVWDRLSGVQKATLRHPVAVRAVACTPPASDTNFCLTGADDGIARLWDLDNPEPGNAVRELKGRHQGRIVCAAFAPDGKTCVTADERDICLWDVATLEMKYRFPAQHRGPITYVQYTPQAKLLSVARDRSICLWRLGEKGAVPETVIDYRTGRRAGLGRQPGWPVRPIRPGAGAARSFVRPTSGHEACCRRRRTPANSRALPYSHRTGGPSWRRGPRTTRCNCGRLRPSVFAGTWSAVWRSGRPLHRPVRAFAPDGSFAVTGTQDDKVVVWKLPSEAETRQELTGKLVFTDIAIDAAERKARVWAELSNSKDVQLVPGDTVTLVIPPPEAR